MTEKELTAAFFKLRIIAPDMFGALVNIVKGFLKAYGLI